MPGVFNLTPFSIAMTESEHKLFAKVGEVQKSKFVRVNHRNSCRIKDLRNFVKTSSFVERC